MIQSRSTAATKSHRTSEYKPVVYSATIRLRDRCIIRVYFDHAKQLVVPVSFGVNTACDSVFIPDGLTTLFLRRILTISGSADVESGADIS